MMKTILNAFHFKSYQLRNGLSYPVVESLYDAIIRLWVSNPANTIFNIRITCVQCRPNVFDVDPPLYKCYTNVCAYWV